TPFGNDSALVTLVANQPHPRLGGGLLVTLRIPHLFDKGRAIEFANVLNYREATIWNIHHLPLLGSWSTDERRTDSVVAYNAFIPNALYQKGYAENCALSMLRRARWVRETWWPDVVDLRMIDILNKRHGK